MKNKIKFNEILVYITACIFGFSFTGCGDSLLDDLSTNQEVIDDSNNLSSIGQAAGMLLTAQQKMHDIGKAAGPHQYQVQFNIHIDNYCGYLCSPQNFEGKMPSTYSYFPEYANGPRNSFFNVSTQVLPIMRSAEELDIREIGAIANIIYCFAALELSDVYGPFPWWDYKNENQEPPLTYTPMPEIYDSLFVNLENSVTVLKRFAETPQENQIRIQNILNEYDRICGSDIDTWSRFANSLRLRMALRISNVDPKRAKLEAEKAITAGVLEKKNVFYDQALDGLTHPLVFIGTRWEDTKLNASLENILKRLNCPLLERWFTTNSGNICDSKGNILVQEGTTVIGIRAGTDTKPRDASNQYQNFSGPNGDRAFDMTISLFKLSEVKFLLAEANLRWNIGQPAQGMYLQGVRQMFIDEGMLDAYNDYYKQTEVDASINYEDPCNEMNSTNGLLTIGVSYMKSADKETQLEQIITQKYIANFPNGLEAWNDLRRTGYPRIFLVDDIGDGTLSNGMLIRRLKWDERESSAADDILNSGIPALGGGNYVGVRLWWDVGNNLFD